MMANDAGSVHYNKLTLSAYSALMFARTIACHKASMGFKTKYTRGTPILDVIV